MVLVGINSYIFEPSSDFANMTQIMGGGNREQLKSTFQTKGFSTTGQVGSFINFVPGTYTLVAGDEWGALIILHFEVQSNG